MNRFSKFLLITILLLTGTCTLVAQVSINSAEMNYVPGLTMTKQNSDLMEIDLGGSGPNQTWDFSGIELEGQYEEYYAEPAGHPGVEFFPEANIVWFFEMLDGFGSFYSYLNINENNVTYYGIAAYIPQMDSTIVGQIETEGYPAEFPVSYGDEWDFITTGDFFGSASRDSNHYEVDAWGTIIDLAGEFECLRIKQYTFSTDDNGEEIETEFDWSYAWIVPGFGEIVRIDSEDNEENPDFSMGEFTRTISAEQVGVKRQMQTELPLVSGLNPAYPNPFNPQTELSFRVAQPGNVSLNVYNASGRQVSTVVSGYFMPGYYQMPFNAFDLSSGVYYARLATGNISQTQTLLLVK